MYNVKAYKNVTKVNEAGDFYVVEELALELKGVVGHAFGTFTFTLAKANGGASVYRYDDFNRIDIEPEAVEAAIQGEAAIESDAVTEEAVH